MNFVQEQLTRNTAIELTAIKTCLLEHGRLSHQTLESGDHI